jgi:hypothetical protein
MVHWVVGGDAVVGGGGTVVTGGRVVGAGADVVAGAGLECAVAGGAVEFGAEVTGTAAGTDPVDAGMELCGAVLVVPVPAPAPEPELILAAVPPLQAANTSAAPASKAR